MEKKNLNLNLKHTANRALITLHCSNRFDGISYGELQTSCSSYLFFFIESCFYGSNRQWVYSYEWCLLVTVKKPQTK